MTLLDCIIILHQLNMWLRAIDRENEVIRKSILKILPGLSQLKYDMVI